MITTAIPAAIPPTGWQCPCCRVVWAPTISACRCQTPNSNGAPGVVLPLGTGPIVSGSTSVTTGEQPRNEARADVRAMVREEVSRAVGSGAVDRSLREWLGAGDAA